jgi:uncharacterized protein (TIGR02646 family)
MTPFRRRPAPPFWAEKEAEWAARAPDDWPRLDPLGWQHESRTLRAWFHERCRDESEPALCAYCDGELYVTARATVDHFAPRARFQALSVTWHNLFPVCDLCNETYKGERWSCALLRPDTDPVDEWLDVELTTGAMRPSATIDDPVIRARVRLTIVVFRLNTPDRCKARLAVVRALRNAWKRDVKSLEHDRSDVVERATRGPYRFVALRFLEAAPVSTRAQEDG